MQDQSELFEIFHNIYSEISTQFGRSLHILTSDNAKEYFFALFKSFILAKGTIHQFSCPHTPQQNGIAKRKHLYLLDTARTMLLQSNVLLKFWVDAILTAGYLINCMPSSVLNNQIPHSILFPDEFV